MNILKNKLKDKSAQALPEFSLCLPLIVLMLGILVTTAQMVYAKEVTQSSAFAGCRAYVQTESESAAKNYASKVLEKAGMNISMNDCKAVPNELKDDKGNVYKDRNGVPYRVGECTVSAMIITLFPVQWNGNTINPNNTFITGYCAMLIEK